MPGYLVGKLVSGWAQHPCHPCLSSFLHKGLSTPSALVQYTMVKTPLETSLVAAEVD